MALRDIPPTPTQKFARVTMVVATGLMGAGKALGWDPLLIVAGLVDAAAFVVWVAPFRNYDWNGRPMDRPPDP